VEPGHPGPHQRIKAPHILSEALKNKLAERLRERIKRAGSITFRDWMQAALYDETDGYYCRRDRIRQGRAGDYRTAPETSPLFAAIFARYFAKVFVELGSPGSFTIIEMGAGAGDFAQGVLNSLRSEHPEVFSATKYLIEEIGAGSREQIAARLVEFSDRVTFRSPAVREGNSPKRTLPDSRVSDTGIIFSNELIDAFPVHRVIGRSGTLKELRVGLNDSNDFAWLESDLNSRVAEYCERIQLRLAEDQVYEINLEAEDFVRRASSLIERGWLITVDYGATRNDLINDPNRFKGTLRTFHRHQLGDDALSHPGEQDLTTTIDWTQMIEAGKQSGFEELTLQSLDQFLLAEGAIEELQKAAATISHQADLFNFNAGARELIMPTGLAAHFHVLVQRKISSRL
jgi:SAM-dependent MidA family methyltransferase